MKELNGMKCVYLENKEEEKAVRDMPVVRNMLNAFLFIFILLLAGCSATKNSTAVEAADERKDIDYTRYDLLYVEGVKKKLEGDLAEAIYKLDEAIRINPFSDAAHYQISQVAAMRRDYDNAVKYGRRAVELDVANPWYHMHMADIYLQISKLDSAAYYLEQLIDVDPEREGVEFQLANIYMQTGNTLKAEEIFAEFYSKYGADEQVVIALLNAKVSNKKYDEAKEIIQKALKSDTLSMQLNGLLAEIYRKTGEKEKAAEIYKMMIAKDENNSTLDFSYLEFLIEEGEYLRLFKNARSVIGREESRLEDKINIVVRMMNDSVIVSNFSDSLISIGNNMHDDDRDNPTITLLMSEIYSRTGYPEKETAILINFIERNEELYYIWENLLLKLNEREDSELLYKYSKRASELFKRAPLPGILYAYSLIEEGKGNEAEKELNKVRLLVNNEERYLVQILSMEAEIAYREDDMQKASEKFEEALRLDPENPLVLNNYAYYLAEKDIRLDYAEEMIEKCLAQEENITYLDTHAWILYKKGKYREAERIMNRIFNSTVVKDAELLEHYGYIKKARGECADAVVLWQAALKEDRNKSYLIKEIDRCVGEK